jgi:hypothetical protein
VRTYSDNSNDHAFCCMLNHGNTLVQLLHCLSVSSCQLDSTLAPTAQLLMSQSQERDLMGIICGFRTPFREFLDSVMSPFMRQTLPTVDRKHFFMNIFCIDSFCPQKTHNRTLLSGVYSFGMVSILTTEISL